MNQPYATLTLLSCILSIVNSDYGMRVVHVECFSHALKTLLAKNQMLFLSITDKRRISTSPKAFRFSFCHQTNKNFGVEMGKLSKLGLVATWRCLFSMLIQNNWCHELKTFCVCYDSLFFS